MASTIQFKRGTTSTVQNYVPLPGEPVWDYEQHELYIGDGNTLGGISVTANVVNMIQNTELGDLSNITITEPVADGSLLVYDGNTQTWVNSNLTNVTVGNSDTLDGLDSTQFLRSDTDDTFEGSLLTVQNDLVVHGNLTVQGETTIIETENMSVKDALIVLNSDLSSSNQNDTDAGIIINRGASGDNAAFIWDESDDKFIVGTTTAVGTEHGDLTVDPIDFQALNIFGNSGQFTGVLTVSKNILIGPGNGSSDNVLSVKSVDYHIADLKVSGNNDGTGRFYVGKSDSYGGGIVFTGNASSQYSNDKFVFFRRINGVDSEVFYFPYNSNDVYFNGTIRGDVVPYDNGTLTYVNYPKDAYYYNPNAATSNGAIKISLPVGWTHNKIRMVVRIYSQGRSFDIHITGDNDSSTNGWTNTSAYIVGDPDVNINLNIRYGYSNGKCTIYLGELNSSWTYLVAAVTDFYCNNYNTTVEDWATGWQISMESSSFESISSTVLPDVVGRTIDQNKIWHAGNDGAGSGLDADRLDGYDNTDFIKWTDHIDCGTF